MRDDNRADDVGEEMVELGKKFDTVTGEIKNFAEDVQKKLSAGENVSKELTDKVDKALLDAGEIAKSVSELKVRAQDIEQKLARRGSGHDDEVALKSMGELVIDSDEFKNGSMRGAGRKAMSVKISRKDITSANATVGTGRSAGTSMVPGDRQPGIVAPPQRKMTIRDLLMPGETESGNIEYVKETGFTNSAGMVAEGAAKPKSDIAFDMTNSPVRTVAHIFKASRQILDDAPQLRSYIDARGRYGLMLREEAQLLNGDGTGQNLLGLLPQATDYAEPAGLILPATVTAVDRLRIAVLQAYLAEYPSSAFVLNPIDWAGIELTKDVNDRYIVAGDPKTGVTPMLWNLPVVDTQAMPQNTFLTGAFNMAAQIFDRMEVEVLLSTENVDDFEKNMVTIRVEERLGFAVYRPEAFVTGDVNPA